MKNKNSLYIIITVILFSLLELFSCDKENPIIYPPEPVDTISKYLWKDIRYNISMYNLFAADTNEIYIVSQSGLLLYDGIHLKKYNLNDLDFEVMNVDGYGKNDIYVAGYKNKGNSNLPAVKKLTNGGIETYIMNEENDIIYDELIISNDYAWFSSFSNSKVYSFLSGIIEEYRITNNDSINKGIFYLNQNNELFVFLNHANQGILFCYKFNNVQFELIRYDTLGKYPNYFSDLTVSCGSDFLMEPRDFRGSVYYFNGYEWIYHSKINNAVPFKIGGVSKDSLVALCLPMTQIYTYNKKGWRSENGSPDLIPALGLPTNIETKFGNVYMTHYDYHSEGGHLIIGIPNQNFKKYK